MCRHRINFGVQLFLYFYHALLVSLGYQIYCQADLSVSSRSTDSMQICAALVGKVEVYDNIHCLHIYASRYQVRAYKCFEFAFPKAVESFQPVVSFHVWVEILILIFLLVEFTRQKLSSFVRSTENDALVDDKWAVNFENGSHLFFLVY